MPCQPDAAGSLSIPTTVYWTQQNNGAICNTQPGTKSKCKTLTTVDNVDFLGQITVKKTVIGGAGESFDFSINPAASGTASFSLAHGATRNMEAAVTETGISYTVTEIASSNFTTSYACTNRDTGVVVTSGTGTSAAFSLSFIQNKVDCVFTNTRKADVGTVTLTKTLPGAFGDTFTLNIDSTTSSVSLSGAGDGDYVELPQVAAGDKVTLWETGANLALYDATLTCIGNGVTMTANTGTSGEFTMPTPAVGVNCTILNKRRTASLTLRKALSPAGDPGQFDLLVGDVVVAQDVGHGGSGSITLPVGSTVTVSETRENGTPVVLYNAQVTCNGSSVTGTSSQVTMPTNGTAVDCSFANSRKTTTVELRKDLRPRTDAGKFNLEIRDFATDALVATTATASPGGVGHDGTTGAITVPVGEEFRLIETAASGTNLAQYTSSLSCSGTNDTSPLGTTSGVIVTGEQPIVCTFVNAQIESERTVTVNKIRPSVATGDSGLFTLTVNGASTASSVDVGDAGTTGPVPVVPGTTVTVAEFAGTGGDLSHYDARVTCTGVEGIVNVPAASARFIMPRAAVSCTFTNLARAAPIGQITITKTSSVAGALTPGGSVTYTVTVSNPSAVALANVPVSDPKPTGIDSQTWTCAGTNGGTCAASGSDAVTDTVNLPAGASVVYTIKGAVSSNPPAEVVNTATATPPSGSVCLMPECKASVSNPSTGGITLSKTSSVSGPLAPGGSVTYAVVVRNTGAVAVNNVAVSDPVPAGIVASQTTWTCAGSGGASCGAASGSGAISDTIASMPAGSSVTYTIAAKAASELPAQVTNTATVTPPPDAQCLIDGRVADPCEAAVSNPPSLGVNVTKTSSVSGPLTPGGNVTYTVVVTNLDAAPVSDVGVTDPMPTGIASQKWSCTGPGGATCSPASGEGTVASTVSLPIGGSVTFSIEATASATLPPQVTNTVTVTPPASTPCSVDGERATPPCQASVSNPSTGGITLSKTSSVSGPLAPGGSVTYTVVVRNTGAVAVNNVAVSDPVPAGIVASQTTWTCAGSGGASCGAASGSGAISDTIASMPAGSSVTYTIAAKAASELPAQVTNTATVTPPPDAQCLIDGRVADPCEASVSNPPEPPTPVDVTPIPTTSPEGLAALALMLLGAAGWAARRQRRGRK